jgi:hypothetical protein
MTAPAPGAGVAEPPGVAVLPRDRHGRPVPWFVGWPGGVPDFRTIGPDKILPGRTAGRRLMTDPDMDMDVLIRDLEAVLAGGGDHAGHERRQVGRCVHCSCGARVQGRGVNLTPAPTPPPARPLLRVVFADGFVAWTGRDPARAGEVAGRHPGARVEPVPPTPRSG